MDTKVIVAIVIAVAVILVILILRNRITSFRGKFTKSGVETEIKAAQPETPPAIGIDLSDAEFKDNNKFKVDKEARVKARGLKAGSGNDFSFGGTNKPSEKHQRKD